MPAKPAFTEPQIRILRETAKRLRRSFKSQEEFALALGVTQPSVSALIRGKWRPGITTAKAIAHLDQTTLEELVGPYGKTEDAGHADAIANTNAPRYPNLEACIRFYAGTRSWAQWTIAAARAGFWGESDLPPPAWPERLDALEKGLERLRRTTAPSG
jgi:transcriptional regulator with XRE-family HTH domain